MARAWFSIVLIAASGWTPAAHAQAPDVTWLAPAPCPSQSQIRARIGDILAHSDVSNAELRASGVVHEEDGTYVLSLQIEQRGHIATRALQDADCSSLGEAAAFLISVAIDPTLPPPTTSPVSPREHDAPPTSSPPAVEADSEQSTEKQPPASGSTSAAAHAVERSEEREPGTAIHWYLGLFGSTLFAGLAGPSPGVGLLAGSAFGPLSFDLSVEHAFVRTRNVGVAKSDFDGQALSLSVCQRWGERLRLGPCVRVSGLRTHGAVTGVSSPEEASFVWATAAGILALTYRVVELVDLQLDGGAWLPVTARPRFEVARVGPVGEVAPVGGTLRVGISLFLP